MLKKIVFSCAVSFVSSHGLAEIYRTEVTGNLLSIDAQGSDTTVIAAGVRYHFSEVLRARAPYFETAFLQRSSNIFASQSFGERGDTDFNELNARVDYFIPDSLFFVSAGISRFDTDNEFNADDDINWSLTAGAQPVKNMLVTTTYQEDIDYELNLNMKYVTRVNTGRYINVVAHFSDGDEDDNYGIGGDYYLDRKTSLGLVLESINDEGAVTLRGRHFFSALAFAGVSFTNSDNQDRLQIDGGFRF